jgi:hypothetical protein
VRLTLRTVNECRLRRLLENLDDLALFEDVRQLLEHCGLEPESLRSRGQYGTIARTLLEGRGGTALLSQKRWCLSTRILEGDLVFIRTIDNVLPEGRWPTVCEHKKGSWRVVGIHSGRGSWFARLWSCET